MLPARGDIAKYPIFRGAQHPKKLADTLGATVGASRAVTANSWVAHGVAGRRK
jgi:hypothetical protein